MIFNPKIGTYLNPTEDILLSDLLRFQKDDILRGDESNLSSEFDIDRALQLLNWYKQIEPRLKAQSDEPGSGHRLRLWAQLITAIGAVIGVSLQNKKKLAVPLDPVVIRCCVDSQRLVRKWSSDYIQSCHLQISADLVAKTDVFNAKVIKSMNILTRRLAELDEGEDAEDEGGDEKMDEDARIMDGGSIKLSHDDVQNVLEREAECVAILNTAVVLLPTVSF